MKPKLGSIDVVGKSGTECVLANKKAYGCSLYTKMVGLIPYSLCSMVTLLGLWGHAAVERRETLGIKHI